MTPEQLMQEILEYFESGKLDLNYLKELEAMARRILNASNVNEITEERA